MTQMIDAPDAISRTGIVLAAFGTVWTEARAGYAAIEGRVRAAYPDADVVWAYTSLKIRQRLAAKGLAVPSVAEALAGLAASGATQLAVQSLHTAPGEEFRLAAREAATTARARHLPLAVGTPLLFSPADTAQAAAALPGFLPAGREPGDTVVLIGHGTGTAGQRNFMAFHRELTAQGQEVVFGTLTGEPGLLAVAESLRRRGARRAWLVPFMSVPGYHVREDIAGTRPGSWAATLHALGITPLPVIAGTTEHPPFADIWLSHLTAALARLENRSHGRRDPS